MKRQLFIAIALIGGTLMFTSCAKLPQAEIAAASAAVQEVKTLGADSYVPVAFQVLVDSMASAESQVATADAKMFKTFKKEKLALANIVTMAADVKVKTEIRIAELTAETISLSAEVKTLNATNKELLTKAPKGKDGKIVLIAIANDIANIDIEVNSVDSLISTDLINSNIKIKSARDIAIKINTELNEAVAKKARK